MVMTLHKLTAGDGYLYLVRQVAAADSTERGRSTLADYYSAKGETPGPWIGRGLAALSDTGRCDVSAQVREQIWTVEEGSGVSEDQMRALYGEGLHPNADRIETYAGRKRAPQAMSAGRSAASSTCATANRSSPDAGGGLPRPQRRSRRPLERHHRPRGARADPHPRRRGAVRRGVRPPARR